MTGQNLSEYQDPEGTKLFVETVEIVKKKGGGYINYLWQWKDDSSKIVPKISYVQLYPEWDWIVGTDIYIEGVEQEIALINGRLLYFSTLLIILILLFVFYTSSRNIKISKEKKLAKEQFEKSKKNTRK